jgi:putative flippase GtrA
MTAELTRIARYAIVGVSNTALTFVTYTLLVTLGLAAPAASAAGFAVGALNGYHLNRRWTFGAARGRILRYLAVQGVGAAASAAGVALARSDGLARLTAELVVIPVVTLMTYVLVRAAVFVPAR